MLHICNSANKKFLKPLLNGRNVSSLSLWIHSLHRFSVSENNAAKLAGEVKYLWSHRIPKDYFKQIEMFTFQIETSIKGVSTEASNWHRGPPQSPSSTLHHCMWLWPLPSAEFYCGSNKHNCSDQHWPSSHVPGSTREVEWDAFKNQHGPKEGLIQAFRIC